jgi:hypothetical protein
MTDRPDLADGRGPRSGVPEAAVIAATRVAAGAAIMAIAGLSAIVNRGTDEGERRDEPEQAVPSRVAAAVFAGAIEAERRAADAMHAAQTRLQPILDAARSNALLRPIDRLRTSSGELADRGAADAERGAEQMLETLDAVIAHVVREVLRHVDLNELLQSVDMNALVARVDIQGLIDRVDPNALLDRLDVDAIARRIDVAALAQRVLDEVQVADVIRESTGTLSVETVDALRRRGADADRRLARFVDSVLKRTNGRDTRVASATADRGAEPP